MFTPILERAVTRVPGAVGAIFADWDGEAVDHWPVTADRAANQDMLILGAQYGVILNHVQSALHLFHFGEAEEVILTHARVNLLVHAVGSGYYIVLAVGPHAHLATALRAIRDAASALREGID